MKLKNAEKKVILILVDGMRVDAVEHCGHGFVGELRECSYFSLDAKTVIPPITLPCHMSLFHSVPPERHGTVTNVYVPQARPVKGLFEVLTEQGKVCASIYNWEELRDLGRPGSVQHSYFINEYHYDGTDRTVTDKAMEYIEQYRPDFLFLYLGVTDTKGHDYGWMSDEYMRAVYEAWNCIERIVRRWEDEYTFIITADHGGHGRSHGENIPEDMTIPLFITDVKDRRGRRNWEEKEDCRPGILDLAPTVAGLLGIEPDRDWEGNNLLGEGIRHKNKK